MRGGAGRGGGGPKYMINLFDQIYDIPQFLLRP